MAHWPHWYPTGVNEKVLKSTCHMGDVRVPAPHWDFAEVPHFPQSQDVRSKATLSKMTHCS